MDEWSLCFVHETVVEKQFLANIRWKKHAKQWMDSNQIPQCWKHGQLVNFKGYGEDDKPPNPMVSAHHHQEDPSHVSKSTMKVYLFASWPKIDPYQSCTCMPRSHSENGSHPPRILEVQDSKLRPNPIHWLTQLLTNPKQGTSKWKTYTTQGVHGVRGNVYGSKIHQSTLRFAIEYPQSYASHCQSTGIIIPHICSYILYVNYHWNHELDC